MPVADGLFKAVPFARLEAVIGDESGAGPAAKPVDQVRYLRSYLGNPQAGARTILVEKPYVDRHWMEEYAGFYATQLHPPSSHAARLHVFRDAFDTATFLDRVRAAADGRRVEIQRALNEAYLGFIVVRPLPSAPVGRTILRVYGGDDARCYEPARTRSDVHLAGLRLEIEGLPFQQQDRGVGACATAALWSSLSKVMRTDGQRPPTPLEITRAATSGRVVTRAFPAADGLNLEQMCAALQHAGYSPHVFRKADEPALFLMALKGYLRSGIPLVVVVHTEDGPHAATFVGFREAPNKLLDVDTGTSHRLRSRGIVRFYVHDDRFGPYARLKHGVHGKKTKEHRLTLEPTEDGFEHLAKPMTFWHAIAPLYPKLRLTVEDLLEFATELLPAFRFFAGAGRRDRLLVDTRLTLSGSYLAEAHALPIDADRKVALATTAMLSRYIGVVRFSVGDDWFGDVVYDGTEIRRDAPSAAPALAVVMREPSTSENLREQAAALRLRRSAVFA